MEIMETKTAMQEVFQYFCTDYDVRDFMKTPFYSDRYVYATDGIIAVRVKEGDCDFKVENNPEIKYPDVSLVFNDLHYEKCRQRVHETTSHLEQYKTADEEIETGQDVECKVCDGEGEVLWEFDRYEKEDKCPVCFGTGFSEQTKMKKTGFKTYDSQVVHIHNAYVRLSYLAKIVLAAEKMKEPLFITAYNKSNNPIFFQFGSIEAVLMPIMYDQSYGDEVIDLLPF